MDGTALVFCEGAFGKREGKIANALVRHGSRYDVLGVIDSEHAGRDARDVVEGVDRPVPVFGDLNQALQGLERRPDYLVIGLSSDYGRLQPRFRAVIKDALRRGISVDSAIRPYLKEDAEFPGLAQGSGARIRSVGFPPPPAQLRDGSGRLDRLGVFRAAVVGTCASAGIVTTAFGLVEALRDAGVRPELIGTGETSWFQGAPYTLILDSIPARYIPGELEDLAVQAVRERSPEVLVFEGQGSVVNPDNLSGVAVLTATALDALILQHAPVHCGTPEDPYGLASVERHVALYENLARARVLAVAFSHEGLQPDDARVAAAACRERFGLPVADVLAGGAGELAGVVSAAMRAAPDTGRERQN